MYHVTPQKVVLHLWLIDGIGPQTCATIVQSFCKNMHEIYMVNARELHMRTGFSHDVCQKIISGLADRALLERELTLIEKHKISFVTISDSAYPDLLRHIHAPPTVLYYQGGPLTTLSPAVAFVGSRKADGYGQQVTEHLIPAVVKEGFVTVSGGARGIDGMVHRATLNAGGKTVAILGSGLLRPYPYIHRPLFEEIVYAHGLVMSPFPLTFEPLPQNFPARNRIIAGLSLATVVIQAAQKSGALLTAKNALDEGRDVGAVPGSLFSELSVGCHELIAQGARTVTRPEDIFDLINHKPTSQPLVTSSSCKSQPVSVSVKDGDPVLALCITPQSTDSLLAKTGYSLDILQDRLWQLQIECKIEQNMLGQWRSLL